MLIISIANVLAPSDISLCLVIILFSAARLKSDVWVVLFDVVWCVCVWFVFLLAAFCMLPSILSIDKMRRTT